MIYKSELLTAASGKLGGTVFSHNKGGPYTRSLVIPVNPATPFQEAVRLIQADLANRWVNNLTSAQRDQWDAYALAVPLPNALGDPKTIGGNAMYIRSNVSRVQAGEPRVDDGPAILDLGSYTAPTIAAPGAAAGTVDISFDNTDDWANEDDAALLIYISRGKNPTINFFKGPYRFAGVVQGDGTTPPVSPATITLPFAVVATQRVFFRFNVSRVDGRLATDFRNFATAVA